MGWLPVVEGAIKCMIIGSLSEKEASPFRKFAGQEYIAISYRLIRISPLAVLRILINR